MGFNLNRTIQIKSVTQTARPNPTQFGLAQTHLDLASTQNPVQPKGHKRPAHNQTQPAISACNPAPRAARSARADAIAPHASQPAALSPFPHLGTLPSRARLPGELLPFLPQIGNADPLYSALLPAQRAPPLHDSKAKQPHQLDACTCPR